MYANIYDPNLSGPVPAWFDDDYTLEDVRIELADNVGSWWNPPGSGDGVVLLCDPEAHVFLAGDPGFEPDPYPDYIVTPEGVNPA